MCLLVKIVIASVIIKLKISVTQQNRRFLLIHVIYIAGVGKSVGSFPPNDDSGSQITSMRWFFRLSVFCIQPEDGERECEENTPLLKTLTWKQYPSLLFTFHWQKLDTRPHLEPRRDWEMQSLARYLPLNNTTTQ